MGRRRKTQPLGRLGRLTCRDNKACVLCRQRVPPGGPCYLVQDQHGAQRALHVLCYQVLDPSQRRALPEGI